jgi:putative transposase
VSDTSGDQIGHVWRRHLAASARGDHHAPTVRRRREDGPGAIQHVIAKGSAGEAIVRDDMDREMLMHRMTQAVERFRWLCLAYCLLDTHFHLIVVTPTANLGQGMQWLLACYAREFNKRHERKGNLFHTRFYSSRIASDEHLTAALVYAHLNPVRAGVVDRAEEWRWSSHAAATGAAAAPELLAVDAVLELFDRDERTARLRLQVAVHEARERDRLQVGVRHGV